MRSTAMNLLHDPDFLKELYRKQQTQTAMNQMDLLHGNNPAQIATSANMLTTPTAPKPPVATTTEVKPKGTPTTIVTPGGVYTTGYIIDGKTYYDPEGTSRVEKGTMVNTAGGWYELTSEGGKKIDTPTTTTPAGTGSGSVTTPSEDTEFPEGYSDGRGHNQVRKDLLTAEQLAQMYGITWNIDDIFDILKEGVEGTYEKLDAESRLIEDRATDMLAQNYDMSMQGFRNMQPDAIQSGATAGTRAAQEVLGLLGAQQTGGDILTDLVKERNRMASTKSSALAGAKQEAMNTHNQITQYLGTLGSNIYAGDVQRYAADAAARAQMYHADAQERVGNLTANLNYQGTLGAANIGAANRGMTNADLAWAAANGDMDILLQILGGTYGNEQMAQMAAERDAAIRNNAQNAGFNWNTTWTTPSSNAPNYYPDWFAGRPIR